MQGHYFTISFLGAIQGTLLGILLFLRKGHHPAAKMLGCYIFIFSLGLLEEYSQQLLPAGPVRSLITGLLASSSYLYGPLLYLFVLYLITQRKTFSKRDTYHFIPFAIGYAAYIYHAFSGSTVSGQESDLAELVFFELFMIQIMAYNVAALIKLKKHRVSLLQNYSSITIHNYKWLYFLVLFITSIYACSFLLTHLIIFGFYSVQKLYTYIQLAITCSVYLLSYLAMFQPSIFIMPLLTSDTILPKYARSGLKSEEANEYIGIICTHMQQHRPYANPDFSLYMLAEQVNISRNHITQLLNEYLHKNFYEFVNEYRIEAVKEMMMNKAYAHLTFAAIGEEAGFKSKTAFNTNFKKITGYTPTEWKNIHKSDESNLAGIIA